MIPIHHLIQSRIFSDIGYFFIQWNQALFLPNAFPQHVTEQTDPVTDIIFILQFGQTTDRIQNIIKKMGVQTCLKSIILEFQHLVLNLLFLLLFQSNLPHQRFYFLSHCIEIIRNDGKFIVTGRHNVLIKISVGELFHAVCEQL